MHEELFEEIHRDHEKLKTILQRLSRTSPSAVRMREKQFADLETELIPHMKSEESTLYPVLREKKRSHRAALEALEEHYLAEAVFHDLDQMDKADETWGPKLKVLKELIEHHIEEEESEIFDLARLVLKEDQASDILEQFREEKEDIRAGVAG